LFAKGTPFATVSSSLTQTQCANLFVEHVATLLLTTPQSGLIGVTRVKRMAKSREDHSGKGFIGTQSQRKSLLYMPRRVGNDEPLLNRPQLES
jgi:hypothetical protein